MRRNHDATAATRMRIGIMDFAIHSHAMPDMNLRMTRALALAGGADSYWILDHLMSWTPASIWSGEYIGAAKLSPSADAIFEPWTALGYLAKFSRTTRQRRVTAAATPDRNRSTSLVQDGSGVSRVHGSSFRCGE
jgi:alkanesulfonate monooxygenase SsuD/methylene tetrahydromethanopterin reductase-like flavin-dependent oxidoreductase (luciferase family)